MSSITATQRARTRLSLVLLASLFPMLSFMGHWPAAIEVPGTGYYVGLPFADVHGGALASPAADAHDHSQHCHGDSASCSDVPATAGVGFGLLNAALAIAIASGLLLALMAGPGPGRSQNSLAPDLQPPRALLSMR